MRLVRELLAADADPALASADAVARAGRYVQVITGGLAVRAAAILVRDPSSGRLARAASTFPAAADAMLADADRHAGTLVARACEERRAFLARRGTEDAFIRALHDADRAVETVAVLPLADRASLGVLVLAGDEIALAADVVKTLNPALRLLAILVSPHRDGGPSDHGAARQVETLRAEIDAQARTMARLESQVLELEAALASARLAAGPEAAPMARPAPVAADVVRPDDAPSTAPSPPPEEETTPTLVVVDATSHWERFAASDRRVVVVTPSADVEGRIAAERPARVIVNLAAPGGLGRLAALGACGVRVPIFGVLSQAAVDRVVGLGVVAAVARPMSTDALVAAVERAAPRGARVFAAGRDAEALMKMRQTLARQGLSVSMARDTKQIDELLAMVRPQVVVIDLELPTRQGYELVMRMAATTPSPALVLIAPDVDPTHLLLERFRDCLAAGGGMGVKQWLTAVAVQKIATRPQSRSTAAVAPH